MIRAKSKALFFKIDNFAKVFDWAEVHALVNGNVLYSVMGGDNRFYGTKFLPEREFMSRWTHVPA